MNITILGTGAYGLALALMFFRNKCSIKMWTKFDEEKEMLEEKREHTKVLPGVKIPYDIKFTTDMKDACRDADLIVIAVPAGFVDSVSSELKYCITQEQHVCIASKGIENTSCAFLSDIAHQHLKTKHVAIMSGPSFAIDMANNNPVGLSLASHSRKAIKVIKNALENDTLKLRETTDLIGVQICGSVKNIIPFHLTYQLQLR